MSGGELDYAFHHIDELANDIERRAKKSLHKAFAEHLHKCAKAAHDLEWMWSGDTSPGDEEAAIQAVVTRTEHIKQAVKDARKALKDLEEIIASTEVKEDPQ